MTVDFSTASVEELADFYRVDNSTWVRSNMVVSLDGNYVDADGPSEGLSSSTDLRILLLLRALSDVVLVGGSTIRREGYEPKPVRAELQAIKPSRTPLAIVTNTLEFDFNSALFQSSSDNHVILTTKQAAENFPDRLSEAKKVSEVCVSEEITGAWLIAQLHTLGYGHILSEGGPQIQQLLLRDKSLDELDVTVAPVIRGQLSDNPAFGHNNVSLTLLALARGDNHSFARYLVTK